MKNKTFQVISISLLSFLIIIIVIQHISNKNITNDVSELTISNKQSVVTIDSLQKIIDSHLLVDKISPIVISIFDKNLGKEVKQVFFIIRGVEITQSELLVGTLDTVQLSLSDTLFSTSFLDTSFSSFQLPPEFSNTKIEGFVSFHFSNHISSFAFSEKVDCWWCE